MIDRTDRFKALIRYAIKSGIVKSQKELGKALGYTNESSFSQIITGKVKEPKDFINKLLDLIPNINTEWLIGNSEQMLKSECISYTEENSLSGKIPFYDSDPGAGNQYRMDMSPVSKPSSLIEIGDELKDSECALRVYGNSMVPNYPAGCIIGLKLHKEHFIEPGQVYVVETTEDRYLKRLYYNNDQSKLRCVSDNTMIHESGPMKGDYFYQDFYIPLEDVKRLYRVVGVIKRNTL